MKKIKLTSIILMLFWTSNVFAQSIQDQLSDLEQENTSIQDGYNVLNSDIEKYNIVESKLEAEISANEAQRVSLANKIAAMNSEKEQLDQDCASYDANCANRTFYLDQPGEQQQYDDCVALQSSLEARISSYNSTYGDLDNEVNSFNNISDQLSQRVVAQKDALAGLNDRENKLKVRKEALDQRYRELANSPAFQQLLNGENISQKCKDMANNGDLEGACHCLQVFWDGAN